VSDAVDTANDIADQTIAIALANRVKPGTKLGPKNCQECGIEIEPKRRELVLGTKHCAECAGYFAKRDLFRKGGR